MICEGDSAHKGWELAESTNPREMTLPAQENRDYSLSRGNSKTPRALGAAPPHPPSYQSTHHSCPRAPREGWLSTTTSPGAGSQGMESGGCWGSKSSHKKSFPTGSHSWERAALTSLQLINGVTSSQQPGACPMSCPPQ